MFLTESNDSAKTIARQLRNSFLHLKARARGRKVFISTTLSTRTVSDLLPPGWGTRETSGFDKLVVQWVG